MAFIPAAERHNLMPAVDRWVIKTAFKYWADTHFDTGMLPTCAVNLSSASVQDKDLIAFIRAQLALNQIPPNRICFEIAENMAIANLSATSIFVEAIKALGCSIALDDFGGGMSSFGYLRKLPIDFIKIDGNLVKSMESNPIDFAMVKSMNEIGHALGIKTIAEFVENESTIQQLRDIGVDFAQGFAIGSPEPLLACRDRDLV
jgi:EAL domain-containing protein (putative c-di-GMP-specific phosphodiesterase class I)